jgi:Arc/MetJ-type ribon-helix-helix transcriptional regulator
MKTDMEKEDWPTVEQKQKCVAQAKALRKQGAEGGLRFEAYLPPQLADWLLERIEKGVFLDPSEAVFVILGEYEELEPNTDLREELLRRRLKAAIDDPRPRIPAEQVFEELRKEFAAPRAEPAAWTHNRPAT